MECQKISEYLHQQASRDAQYYDLTLATTRHIHITQNTIDLAI